MNIKDEIEDILYATDLKPNEIERLTEKLLNLYSVINWVSFKDKKPDKSGTYLVKNKYHVTAEYDEWRSEWTVNDADGYEVEVFVDEWKPIT